MATGKRFKSTRRIAARLTAKGNPISHASVHTMLRAQTLFPYRRVVRPKQQLGDKTRRMAWCTVERGRSADGWANTWFADEKHFRLHARPNRKNDIVWARSPGVVPVAPSEKYAGTVSVYGAFSKHGVSKLYIFKGNNNSTEMAMMMGKTLVPSVLAAQHGKEVWYLHDNDSKCQAAVVTGVLDANGIKRWQKGVFPARSPDLNPIENAWGAVAARVNELGPANMPELRAEILRAWREVMTPQYRASLANSMQSRVRAVLRARGAYTKY
jgi:hypothetical protein